MKDQALGSSVVRSASSGQKFREDAKVNAGTLDHSQAWASRRHPKSVGIDPEKQNTASCHVIPAGGS